MQERVIVIHYAEIGLKGANRIFFEKKLMQNIRRALQSGGANEVVRRHGRLLVYPSADLTDTEIRHRLKRVFGIAYFSFALAVERDLTAFCETSWQLLRQCSFDSFRVSTKRSQKDFPLTSVEVNCEVGQYLGDRCNKRVDLKHADATVVIEIIEKEALVYVDREEGARGLPVGVSEKAVSLLSSGIDSPVSSYLMMKRGVKLVFVHFHSQPYTNPASQELTEKLVEHLTAYQYYSRVYFVPFIEIQKEIMAKAPAELRVILYRRYMIRLATEIAEKEEARALVTGENVGQVASQTLSNIRTIEAATELPILRPLAGFDKEEIIARARAIGTFEISTQPYEDCCSLFVPDSPATKSRPEILAKVEEGLEVADLLTKTLQETEVKVFKLKDDARPAAERQRTTSNSI